MKTRKDAPSFFLYPLGSILASTIFLIAYSNHISSSSSKAPEGNGLLNATPTKSDYMCTPGTKDYTCEANALNHLKKNNSIILLGNSQMYAVNQIKNGEIGYGALATNNLNKRLAESFVSYSFAIPNASLSEFKAIVDGIKSCTKPARILIIPAFLDDTRESEIRNSISMYEETFCKVGEEGSTPQQSKQRFISDHENSEFITIWLKSKLPFIKQLQTLNTHTRGYLYMLRNTIFNISASSIRPITRASYQKNIESLKTILRQRLINKDITIVYIPPLLHASNSKPIPYKREDYAEFKKTIEAACKRPHCYFYNLESLVPDELWGTKNSTSLGSTSQELDFMHFTYSGHKLLSDKLTSAILNAINYSL